MNIKTNHATQKTQRQTHGPTGLCELFLLTVPMPTVPSSGIALLNWSVMRHRSSYRRRTKSTVDYDYEQSTKRRSASAEFNVPLCSAHIRYRRNRYRHVSAKVATNPSTNPARRSLPLLMRPTTLSLSTRRKTNQLLTKIY